MRKMRKIMFKKKRHRQEFIAREIRNDRVKAASYELEPLATIELLPPRTKPTKLYE